MMLHVCDSDERESKGIIADENLSHVCSADEIESESVIVNESSTEESESESVHKIINTNKERIKLMKQSMRNLPLQIIHLSMSRYILPYPNVVKLSITGLTPRANERAWKPQETNIIRKVLRP